MLKGIALSCCCLPLVALASSAASSDELWRKAVKSSPQGANWRPGEIAVMAQAFADSDETGREEMFYVVRIGAAALAVMTRHLVNGVQTTDGVGESIALENLYPLSQPLFDAANQSSIQVARKEDSEIDGTKVATFEFSMQAVTGSAALDLASGYPVQTIYRPSALPDGVTSMVTKMDYDSASPGAPHLRKMTTTMTVKAADPVTPSRFVTSFAFLPSSG